MMNQFPDFTMARIGARMIDIIADIKDDEHRARTAELFAQSGFHGLIEDGKTVVEVRTTTVDGSLLLARLDGVTVGYVLGADGRPDFLP